MTRKLGGKSWTIVLDDDYVKPTVFARVTNDMTVAREEIFPCTPEVASSG
ncbi:aldehyde dehydrogenase family protein [Streptomyces sp. NPDC090798]